MASVVSFEKGDIPAFVEFRKQAKADSEFLNGITEDRAVELQAEYQAADKKALLLKDGKDIIGQLFMRFDADTRIVGLGLISVLSLHQGKGYGQKLLNEVDQYAMKNKALRVDLYVDVKNIHAVKVYERAGYRKLKDHGRTRFVYSKTIVKPSPLTKSTSADGLLDWMKDNLIYYGIPKEYLYTAEQVVREKKGHCWETAELAYKELTSLGYVCQLVFIHDETMSNTHTTLLFKEGNEFSWFEWAWGSHEGIHRHFKTVADAVSKIQAFFEKNPGSSNIYVGYTAISSRMSQLKYIEATARWHPMNQNKESILHKWRK